MKQQQAQNLMLVGGQSQYEDDFSSASKDNSARKSSRPLSSGIKKGLALKQHNVAHTKAAVQNFYHHGHGSDAGTDNLRSSAMSINNIGSEPSLISITGTTAF